MASSAEEVEEVEPELFFMLYNSAHTAFWPQKSAVALQGTINKKNFDFVESEGWLRHLETYDKQRTIKDSLETHYFALVKRNKTTKKLENLAHCKIVPGIGVTIPLSERHYLEAGEHLIVKTATQAALAFLSPTNTEQSSNQYLQEKEGYYTINPSKDAAEIIQFYGPLEGGLMLTVGLYLLASYPKNDEALQKLNSPFLRSKSDRFTEDDQTNFLNIFKQRIFYATSWASSIPLFCIQGLNEAYNRCFVVVHPDGLENWLDDNIAKNDPYSVFNQETNRYESTDLENSKKWRKNAKNQWDKIYPLWQKHMQDIIGKNGNLKAGHEEFVHSQCSEIESIFRIIAEAVGADPFKLGPIVGDLDEHLEKLKVFQAFLLPPYCQEDDGFFLEKVVNFLESKQSSITQKNAVESAIRKLFKTDKSTKISLDFLKGSISLRYNSKPDSIYAFYRDLCDSTGENYPPILRKDPYHFAAQMVINIRDYALERFNIDIFKIEFLGPTLQPVFPNGYLPAFWQQIEEKAEELRGHLGGAETTEMEDQETEKLKKCSFFRKKLPELTPEQISMSTFYSAALKDR
jgi:hypothetical protein